MRWRDWQAIRAYVLERDKHACVRCGEHESQLQVDHMLPKKEYPQYELDANNLQTLCLHCHQAKGIEEARLAERMKLLTKKEKIEEQKKFAAKQKEKQRYKKAIACETD